MTSLSARVPAAPAALGGVRSSLAKALTSEGWGGEPVERVLTASTEALANALQHGSAPGAGVDVAFRVSGEAASVRVLDQGRPCSRTPPNEVEAPPVTSTNGRGRLLMRGLADEVQIRRQGSGTKVVLGFRAK
jgi:anti-sigma regulatory factor (Ser/Thr protein kinase)